MSLISDLGHWVLAWGDSPWGSLALFVLAFWESSFFPIPPDGLMIALAAGNLSFALGFSGIATAGSLLGAMLGYWIDKKRGGNSKIYTWKIENIFARTPSLIIALK